MSYDEPTTSEEDAPESEAVEAEGVAEIDMQAAPLRPEEAIALDRQTLEGLDEEERAELAGGAGALEVSGPVALSANFLLAEFHCCRGHCAQAFVPAGAVPALRRLVTQVLQPMRDEFGRCTVHSGFRNAAHNAHVRGEERSRHRYDLFRRQPAADVEFASGDVEAWATEARRLLQQLGNIGGIGRYPAQRFVHVDLGPKRSWPTPGL